MHKPGNSTYTLPTHTSVRSLFETLPLPVLVLDKLGRLRFANDASHRLGSFQQDEVLTDKLEVSSERWHDLGIYRAMARETTIYATVSLVVAGQQEETLLTVRPVRNRNGQVSGAILFFGLRNQLQTTVAALRKQIPQGLAKQDSGKENGNGIEREYRHLLETLNRALDRRARLLRSQQPPTASSSPAGEQDPVDEQLSPDRLTEANSVKSLEEEIRGLARPLAPPRDEEGAIVLRMDRLRQFHAAPPEMVDFVPALMKARFQTVDLMKEMPGPGDS